MNRQRGFAMVWAAFLLLLVGAAGALVLERDQVLRRDGDTDLRALAARHAAEGGVAWAQRALSIDPAWSGERVRIGACDVEVSARPDGEDRWTVVAHATPGNVRVETRLAARFGRVEVVDWRSR
jgi:hypothetical protein